MKYYLALLFGAAICFGAIAPTTAEARPFRGSSHHDRHDDHRDRDRDRHGHFDRSHRHHHHHHHGPRYHRVLRKAHFEWHRGHRVWIPARWVTVYY